MTGAANSSVTGSGRRFACGVVLALLALVAQALLPAVHAWTCQVATAEHCAAPHAAAADCLDALTCVDPDHRHGPTVNVGHGDAAHPTCATCAALQHLNPSPTTAPAIVAAAPIVTATAVAGALPCPRDLSVHGARAPPLA